jgi:hypothetical protein
METKLSLDYLAGFFDGEGCINISRGNGTSYYLLQVQVSNTRREVLDAFQDRFGGSIVKQLRNGNHKDIYIWKVEAAKAESFLIEMSSRLVLKRKQAELALEFRSFFKGKYAMPRGHLVNDHSEKIAWILASREICYEEMGRLNKRGVVV